VDRGDSCQVPLAASLRAPESRYAIVIRQYLGNNPTRASV